MQRRTAISVSLEIGWPKLEGLFVVVGAGDSLLISSAMAMTAGATPWEAAYIGSVAAAVQVSRVGNVPLDRLDLVREFD